VSLSTQTFVCLFVSLGVSINTNVCFFVSLAVCINTNGSFVCLCHPNWTGKRCETRFIARDDPTVSRNNGTCYATELSFHTCNCTGGSTNSTTSSFPNETNSLTTTRLGNGTISGNGTACARIAGTCNQTSCANRTLCFSVIRTTYCICTTDFTGNIYICTVCVCIHRFQCSKTLLVINNRLVFTILNIVDIT